MRIPDLERQIEMQEIFYREHCKNCGKHKKHHTQKIADSSLYCYPTPGIQIRRVFQSMVE